LPGPRNNEDKDMNETGKGDLPPCMIFIDKEGRWYHDGIEMIRRTFIRFFYKNMALDSQGRYVINWNGKQCQVDVEDTAFVIRRVLCQDGKQGQDARFVLYLSDDTQEDLIPETLFVGKDNVMYCRIKKSIFPARFNRAAYYQLAQYIEEGKGNYYLPLNKKKYKIPGITLGP